MALPKKWCIRRTPNTSEFINRWFNRSFPEDPGTYFGEETYIYSEDVNIGQSSPKTNGRSYIDVKGFQEIDIKQFREMVEEPINWKKPDKYISTSGNNRIIVQSIGVDTPNRFSGVVIESNDITNKEGKYLDTFLKEEFKVYKK